MDQSEKHGQGRRRQGRPAASHRRRADPVRRVAYDVLWAVDQRDAYANLLLPALLRERGIEGRDAALATELTYGTLRGLQTYDAILDLCSDRSPGQIDPPVREVLRLGAHQLLATRVASHAAVATSVDLAKDVAGMRPAGFVNAVLRRVGTREQAEWLRIIAPDRAADPAGFLAATYSYPRWIVEAFRGALGEDAAGGLPETEEALAAGNTRPKITLAALPGLADRRELLGGTPAPAAEGPAGKTAAGGQASRAPGAEPAPWSPFGVILSGGDPAAIPAVAEGRAFVQDEASQLAALALAYAPLAGPADTATGAWLDLCAGPGGKSAVLAAVAHPSAPPEVTASPTSSVSPVPTASPTPNASPVPTAISAPAAPSVPPIPSVPAAPPTPTVPRTPAAQKAAPEIHLLASDVRPHRAELTRAHLRNLPDAAVVAADGRAGAWRPGTFDRVLADVPCSGLGALRRRPEARWRKSPEDVENLGGLQHALLNAAIDAARPGGVVAYVTCSPHRAETQDVLRDVLASRADVTVLDAPALLTGALREASAASAEIPGLRSPAPGGRYAQFWPHRHGTDAIFLALLRREHPEPADRRRFSAG